MIHRLLPWLFVLVSTPVVAMSEDAAVSAALVNPDVEIMLAAQADAAAGRADAVGRWANPEVEYVRESLDGFNGDSDDHFLVVRQRWNPAGARGLERAAAEEALDAERTRIEYRRREIVAAVRSAFHDVLAARGRLEAVSSFRRRLSALVDVVSARADAGEASEFDALRLRRSLAVADGDLSRAEAVHAAAELRLASLTATDAVVTGELMPPEAVVSDEVATDPRASALAAEGRAATLRARAAEREAWPDLTLGVGVRRFDQAGQQAEGGVVSIGIELPVFDRARGRRDAARAEAIANDAERRILERRLEADADAATTRLAAERRAAARLADSSADADRLARIAEAAHAAGEVDVLALIDAHESALDSKLRSLDHARAARAAYIQLQTLGRVP